MTKEARKGFCCAAIVFAIAASAAGLIVFILHWPYGRGDVDLESGWPNNGRGLNIFLMNSLDDNWTDIFEEYIQIWDSGTPDALTLTSGKFRPDPDCTPYNRVINVCNGNYGETGWSGIAYVWRDTSTSLISASTAQLNDYYLNDDNYYRQNANLNERKYTMCHEIGHAFGLPHTDTNHYNLDLNNCLDYTLYHGNNLFPGQINYDRLYELYGPVPDDETGGNGRNRRRLGSALPPVTNQSVYEPFQDSEMEKFKAVMKCLETSPCSACQEQLPFVTDGVSGDESEQGEDCKLTLDGYVVESHKLLVS